MATSVGELFITLAVDAVSGNLSVRQLASALGDLDVVSVGSVGIITKITQALYDMASAATLTAVDLESLKDTAGTDPKMTDQWEKTAQRIGIHAGAIMQAIRGVNAENGQMALRHRGPNGTLSQLGILSTNGFDAATGNPVGKNFYERFHDLLNSKEFWKYSEPGREELVAGVFPGGDNLAIYRLLKLDRAGHFHPENTPVPSNKTDEDLAKVYAEATRSKQAVVGTFTSLLTGGGKVSTQMASFSTEMERLNKLKGMDKATGFLRDFANLHLSLTGPNALLNASNDPYNLRKMPPGGSLSPLIGHLHDAVMKEVGELHGKLEVIVKDANGGVLGAGTAHIDRDVNYGHVDQVNVNSGNGGKIQ